MDSGDSVKMSGGPGISHLVYVILANGQPLAAAKTSTYSGSFQRNSPTGGLA